MIKTRKATPVSVTYDGNKTPLDEALPGRTNAFTPSGVDKALIGWGQAVSSGEVYTSETLRRPGQVAFLSLAQL